MNFRRLPITTGLFAAIALGMLIGSAHAQEQAAPPPDVDYWVCKITGKKLEWGAVGVIIDEWDTPNHGAYRDRLIWYHYRYLYPDGRTYAEGYDWVDRKRPDPTVKPGSWAIHNWPVRSPEDLIPLDIVAVKKTVPRRPGELNPELAIERPPMPEYQPQSRVVYHTRWYPPPPQFRTVVVVRPMIVYTGFYAGYSCRYGPYWGSRFAVTTTAYVAVNYRWGGFWRHYQYQTAVLRASMANLRNEFNQTLQQDAPLTVDYVDELNARLQGLDQYVGSPVDRLSGAVRADANDVFAGVPNTGTGTEQAARLAANFMDGLPIPDTAAVAALNGIEATPEYSEEVAANLAKQLAPLPNPAAQAEIADVAMLNQRLQLWTGEGLDWGDSSANRAAPRLVSASLISPADPEAELSAIERAARSMDSNTAFATAGAGGIMQLDTGNSTMRRATFAITASGELSAEVQQNYRPNAESVNLAALMPADESDEMVAYDTTGVTDRATRLAGVQWQPLPVQFANTTKLPAFEALYPPPGLRGQVEELWATFHAARSRNR